MKADQLSNEFVQVAVIPEHAQLDATQEHAAWRPCLSTHGRDRQLTSATHSGQSRLLVMFMWRTPTKVSQSCGHSKRGTRARQGHEGAPAERSVLGTGMVRGPEPLLVVGVGADAAAAAAGLLTDASAALCICFSGDSSSSIIGLHRMHVRRID